VTGLEYRAPRLDEAEAVAALANVSAQRLWGADDTIWEDLVAAWTAPGTDIERNALVAVEPGGELVGYGFLYDVAHGHSQLWLFVRTLDPGPSPADAIYARLEDRARAVAAPGAVARASAAAHESDRHELLAGLGYRVVRHAFRMETVFEGEPPATVWPAGIAVRTFDPTSDAEATYEADMEAFADHWGFQRESLEDWKHWMFRPPFDPELCFLAFDGDELAGFSMCPPHKEGEPDLGWVGNLGVRPAWRRRGLGLALLLHSFRAFHARGFRRVGLGVDGENTTGAVRLYERAGMRVARRWDQYEKALDG
jgi:mycothiol synthase